jgi:hypothetical protein
MGLSVYSPADHWVEYNGEAVDNASHCLHRLLDSPRQLKADRGNRNRLLLRITSASVHFATATLQR